MLNLFICWSHCSNRTGGLQNHSGRFGEEKYRLPLLLFEQADRRVRSLVAISTRLPRLLCVHCWMKSWKKFEIICSWPKQDMSRTYFWTDWENPQKTWVRLADFPVEIWTRHLPGTCAQDYRYPNLVSVNLCYVATLSPHRPNGTSLAYGCNRQPLDTASNCE